MRITLAAVAAVELVTAAVCALGGAWALAGAWLIALLSTIGWLLAVVTTHTWRQVAEARAENELTPDHLNVIARARQLVSMAGSNGYVSPLRRALDDLDAR